MTKKDKNGGSAFPHSYLTPPLAYADDAGMTLRDWFAGRAIQALVETMAIHIMEESGGGETAAIAIKNTARLSYAIADAMIKERG